MESLGLEFSYIYNNYGNKDVVFRGYIYTKRTNMVKACKKSCNYRHCEVFCRFALFKFNFIYIRIEKHTLELSELSESTKNFTMPNYRCANRKCSASISLKTIRDFEGTNFVFEPFIVVHCQTSHCIIYLYIK